MADAFDSSKLQEKLVAISRHVLVSYLGSIRTDAHDGGEKGRYSGDSDSSPPHSSAGRQPFGATSSPPLQLFDQKLEAIKIDGVISLKTPMNASSAVPSTEPSMPAWESVVILTPSSWLKRDGRSPHPSPFLHEMHLHAAHCSHVFLAE